MSAREFMEHAAYDQLSPIGPERLDYLAAMIATVLANLWSKKRHKLKEFLPQWGKQRKRGSTPQEIIAWAKSYNESQKRGKRGK